MNATLAPLRDRLDEIESSLPPLAAKALRFQRDIAERVERDTARLIRRWRRSLRGSGTDRAEVDESLTRAELYRQAQEREIPGRSGMNKAELVAALQHA